MALVRAVLAVSCDHPGGVSQGQWALGWDKPMFICQEEAAAAEDTGTEPGVSPHGCLVSSAVLRASEAPATEIDGPG